MAIKTTIGPKGVVSETIAGTKDELVVDIDRTIESYTSTSADGTGVFPVAPPVTFLRPGTGGLLTGSLPAISTPGQRMLVTKDDTNGTIVLSGTANKVVQGTTTVANATWEFKTNVANAAYDLVSSISGSTYFWHAAFSTSGSYAAAF